MLKLNKGRKENIIGVGNNIGGAACYTNNNESYGMGDNKDDSDIGFVQNCHNVSEPRVLTIG